MTSSSEKFCIEPHKSVSKVLTRVAITSRVFLITSSTPDPMEIMCAIVFDVLGHHMDFQSAKYAGRKIPVQAVK